MKKMMFLVSVTFLFSVAFTESSFAAQSGVIGKLLRAEDLGSVFRLSGWACEVGVASSVDVHLYAGGVYGTGSILQGKAADLPNTPDVDLACGTSAVPHGFQFDLPRGQFKPHVGEALYVYGIHVNPLSSNRLLDGSGSVFLPQYATYLLSEVFSGQWHNLNIAGTDRIVINRSADLGIINVQGQLVCPQAGDFVLRTLGLLVEGDGSLFECGNEHSRFLGSLTIAVRNGVKLFSQLMPSMNMGTAAIGAMHGGTIRLFGDGRNAGWQRIAQAIAAGSDTVVLSIPAPDWSVGDRIVVGSTSYNYLEAEERFISSIGSDKRTIRVSQPFAYSHFGRMQKYSSPTKTWYLDERAEIANLTRNIRIQTDGDEAVLDSAQMGGHVMIMDSAYGYLDGVELVRLGQLGVLGRYPFHWHLAGYVPGQFIRNSSIRNSYQRCATIHGSHRASIINNVCFNHFGHGYFLENGSETENVIDHNLAMLSKRVPKAKALLISDVITVSPDKFSAGSGFWISNPKNYVRNNVASGGEGTGIWMAFSKKIICNAERHCLVDPPASFIGTPVYPSQLPTLSFVNNIAHGYDVGINWDGASDGPLTDNPLNANPMTAVDRDIVPSHYWYDSAANPAAAKPVFKNLVVFKNRRTGIYFRGNTVEFQNVMAADNRDGFFLAYNQVVKDSLVVAFSQNHSVDDLKYLYNKIHSYYPIHGVRLYDGPFALESVHFAGFPTQPVTYQQGTSVWNATPVPFFSIGGFDRFSNSVRGLSFEPRPMRLLDLETLILPNWQDKVMTAMIRDLDGSLAGDPGAILVPNSPLMTDASCSPLAPPEQALRCHYDLGILVMGHSGYENNDVNKLDFNVQRSDGAGTKWDSASGFNKVGLIANGKYQYRITFNPIPTGSGPQPFPLRAFRATYHGVLRQMSPVIELVGLRPSCDFTTAKEAWSLPAPFQQVDVFTPYKASSLADLNSLQSLSVPLAYYKSGSGRVFVRYFPLENDPVMTSADAAKATDEPG